MNGTTDERLYLTLDQGGHASRALVFDQQGNLVVKSLKNVRVQHPAPDRVEQNPDELVASLQQAAEETVQALGKRARHVVSAGMATQRSSIVCWDNRTGAALSPVISWQDRRAHAWLAQFSAHAEEIQHATGLRLSPHYGASKLRWCLDNLDPVIVAHRAGRLALGPLASFLLFRLLKENPLLVDPANAARTLLCNRETLDWDSRLLLLFGIPLTALPQCVTTQYPFGTLCVAGREIPLTVTTGDQSAALFAFGAAPPHNAYLNLGTGAFVQRTLTHPQEVASLLTGVVYRDAVRTVYVLEGTVNGAGAALQWVQEKLGLVDIERQLPLWLMRLEEPPLFLNGVSGLGAPYWVSDFASRFIGEAEPWRQAVAVAESIIFLIQANIAAMEKVSPPLEQLIVTGGLGRHDALCQRLADLSGLPVQRPAEYEATARGTAYLLVGFSAEWPAQASAQFTPAPNRSLQERYQRWCDAMQRAIALGNR